MIHTIRYMSKFVRSKSVNACSCNVANIFFIRKKSDQHSLEDITVPKSQTSLGNMSSKYQIYEDEDSETILDVYEERLKYSNLLEEEPEENRFEGLNLERGITGVYNIEDLVETLKREQAQNIFVASVPKEINYIEHICIVSGKSVRHMQAIAQFVRRVYKQKRESGDFIPKIEGKNSKDWLALDLGNIALHIFAPKARVHYDLESLWTLGFEFDEEYNKPEPVSAMLEKHSIYLQGFVPAS